MKKLLTISVLLALAATVLVAQEEEEKTIQITAKQGGWDIEDLFRTISDYTGQSIVFDPQSPEIRGRKIEFVGTQEVPKDKLFEWFQSLLSFQRLVLVPVGPTGHEQWMALGLNAPQITTRPRFVREEEIEQWADRDGVYIVSTITVKNLTDTSRARNALAQLSTRQIGRINDVPGNLAFVVGDFAPVVASMYRLLKAMDVQPLEYRPIARTYPLVHAVASEVEPILGDLLQSDPRTQRPTARTQAGVPEKPDPQIIADTRQDAIIVYAVPEDHEQISELIEILDQEVHYKRGTIHYRPVKHTNASELADLLTEVVTGTGIGGRTTPGRPARPAQPGGGQLTGNQSDPIIVADDRSNSLLIQATATQLSDIEDIIKQVDVPRDQVLVEAALVELSVDDLIQFGVEFLTPLNQGNENERTFFAGTRFGLSSIIDTDGDDIPDINVPNLSTQGLTAGIFDDGQFPLIVQALGQNGRAQALSIPSVVVEDGAEATMLVSDQEPYTVRTTNSSGETSFSVEFVDAEIRLNISPHISSDNYLRLHIFQTVQAFSARINDELPPPKTNREIDTDIVVPDGYTVVMGGLIDEKVQETDQGIPYLRDIPVLGYLFGAESKTRSTTSLFLFVTPHILKQGPQGDFNDYHRITWERKLLADELLQQAVRIYNARFRDMPQPPEAQPRDDLEEIQDSGYLDRPRYLSAPPTQMTVDEARRRFEELRKEKEIEDRFKEEKQ